MSTPLLNADVWDTLASTYAKPSKGHIHQIKQQINSWKKGSRTIDEYQQGFTVRFDHLALLGKPEDHEEQIDHILQGLLEESVIDQTEGPESPPTITELHEKLLNHEAKLLSSTPADTFPITANFVNNRNHFFFLKNNQQRKNNQNSTWSNQQNSGQQRTFRPYLGRCQICGI